MANKETSSGTIEREILGEGKYLRLTRDKSGWECAERKGVSGAAVITAVTDEGKIILVEQYRPPLATNVIELPAGLDDQSTPDAKESMKTVAMRELYEETGYSAREMIYLLKGPSSPGLSNEQFTLFMAKGLKKTGPGGGDEKEDIIIHEIPLEGAEDWLRKRIDNGLSVDPKVFLGLYFIQKEDRVENKDRP